MSDGTIVADGTGTSRMPLVLGKGSVSRDIIPGSRV